MVDSLRWNDIDWEMDPDGVSAIHHLALSAALCEAGDEGFTKLAALASRFPFEDSQHDILLALAYADNEPNRTLIQEFAEQHTPQKFDLAIKLALAILRSRQKSEDFQPWIEAIAAKSESAEIQDSILDWAGSGLKTIEPLRPQKGFMKVWHGFTLTIYDDGFGLTFVDQFSGFMSRP